MKTLGDTAEQLAAIYLQQQGLTLITSNYRCKFGEIDLVMRDAKTLVFVEVRLRTNSKFGGAGGSITPAKQRKLAMAAEHYLQNHGQANCRFDAILMEATDTSKLEWIRNAFEV